MHVKTMEGLVGARTNMNLLNTPMRVYNEARRKGDTATMERAMGYAGEFADKAEEYKAEAEKGMEEEAREAREKEKLSLEEPIRNGRSQVSSDGVEEAGKAQGAAGGSEGIPVPKDEYISSGQSGSRPSGLYRMARDENGNPKVLYDDPKKADGAGKKVQLKAGSDSPEEDAEKCTTNTDKVDREIEKLKKQKQQLEQQIRAASGEGEKGRELEKELSRIEGELSQKDNDAYRRQNAVIS